MWGNDVDTFCKIWRQGQRAVWKLPFNTHRRYLSLMCNSISIEDEICKRFLAFVYKCVISQNELVQFIVRHGIMFGRMFSLCGRNTLFCAQRFNFNPTDVLYGNFNCNIVNEYYAKGISDSDITNVLLLMELTFIRDNIYEVPRFTKQNVIVKC